jgi:hypothetical protein
MKTGSTPVSAAHAVHYEELRQQAVERRVPAGRLGLAVLLRQGLAAWVELGSKVSRPSPVWPNETAPCPLPGDASGEVIHVLATMALGHLREVTA